VPAGGLHYRWPDLPGPQIEERMEAKKHAVFAFRRGKSDRPRIYGIQGRPVRHRHHRQRRIST
jgi:indolepyruvate ferredoxin oxidoreductase